MRTEKEIEDEINLLAARLKKGGFNTAAMSSIRTQIRTLYWALNRDIPKGKYHWAIDD